MDSKMKNGAPGFSFYVAIGRIPAKHPFQFKVSKTYCRLVLLFFAVMVFPKNDFDCVFLNLAEKVSIYLNKIETQHTKGN
jgi:hypothetical protein